MKNFYFKSLIVLLFIIAPLSSVFAAPANKINGDPTVGTQSGSITEGMGGTATYSVTFPCTGGGNSNSITGVYAWTSGPTPDGTSFSPTSGTLPGSVSSFNYTLTVTDDGTTPAGTYTFTIQITAGNTYTSAEVTYVVDAAGGSDIVIGTGSSIITYFPFYNYYENERTQILYLQSEIGSDCTITDIAFDIYQVATAGYRDFDNFTIKLMHTSETSLGGAFEDMSGATQVFYSSDYDMPTTTGWHTWDITDFPYNGTDNLLVEIIWGDNGEYSSTYYKLNGSTTGFNSVAYGYDDSQTPPTYDSWSQTRPNITLTTIPSVPLDCSNEPTGLGSANITTSAADISWTENSTAIMWDIEYNTTNSFSGTPTLEDESNPYGLSGLTQNTTYYFKVRSDCGGSNSSWSTETGTFTTLDCDEPSSLNASNITSSSADLSWTENGPASDWDIEYNTTGSFDDISDWNTSNNPQTLPNLTSNTTYYYQIRSDCGSENSSWVDGGSFTTDPCSDVSGVSSSNVTSSSADISWTENGDATEWDIEYNTTGTFTGTPTVNNTSSNPYTITGLSGNTTYYFQVRSQCGTSSTSSCIDGGDFTTSISYCTSTASNSTYSSIEGVELAGESITLNKTSSVCTGYSDFTTGENKPDLDQGGSYSLTVTYGSCSSSYASGVAAWIDYNQDGDFGDAGEQICVVSSESTGPYVFNFTVPAGATPGDTRIRIILDESSIPSNPCFTGYSWGETEDYTITINTGAPMVYTSSNVFQNNTADINPGSTDVEIIGIEVVTTNSTDPFALTNLAINMDGTTSLTDVNSIDVYYTASSNTFATTTTYSTGTSPAAGTINISGSLTLQSGSNYFWIAYNLNSGASMGNFIDAECTQITMDGSIGDKTPSTTDPAGNREIANTPDGAWPGYSLGTLSCPSTTYRSDNTSGADDDCDVKVGSDHIYSFTIDEAADVEISLCGAGTAFDTELFLFNENAGACNDEAYITMDYNSCGVTSSVITKENLAAGTYIFVIAGTSSASGAYDLSIDVSNCASYIDEAWPGYDIGTLTCPYARTFTESTADANDDCSYNTGNDHIYSFTLTESMNILIDLCNSTTNFDSYIYLYELSTSACTGGGFLYSNNDASGCGTKSIIEETLAAGDYVLIIEGNSGASGDYEMTISADNTCSTLLNAIDAGDLSSPYSDSDNTSNYTDDLPEEWSIDINSDICGDYSYYDGPDAVYTFTPASSGEITITMDPGTKYYSSIMLYDNCPLSSGYQCGTSDEGTCLGNSDQNSSATVREITQYVTAGHTYYLVVDANSTSGYSYNLDITSPTIPSCIGSLGSGNTYVSSLPYSTSGSTCGGVNDITGVNAMYSCGSYSYLGGEDNVYYFTPESTGTIDINLTKTVAGNDVAMWVYEGCPFNSSGGTCLEEVQNTSTADMSMSVCVETGKVYYLVLDTYPSPTCFDFSNLTISATICNTGTGNVSIASLPYYVSSETTNGAVNDVISSSAFVDCWNSTAYMDGEDKVYSFTPDVTGEISIDMTNISSNDGSLTLYEGCPVSDCDPGTCVGYLHDNTETNKTLKANVESGLTYYLLIDSYGAAKTDFTYDLDITYPGNLTDDRDFCASAPNLQSSPTNLNLDFTGITDDYPSNFDDITCISGGEPDNNMWYKFIPTSTEVSFEFNNIAPSFSALQVEIYESVRGKCGQLTSVSTYCNNTCTTGDFTITANVFPGSIYYLMIDGCAGATPSFDLTTSGISSGGGSSPLPIILSNFTAKCNDNNVIIEWETSTEINNDYYLLQKSTDGANFNVIANIDGAGNSTETNRYSYIDKNSDNNDIYYRLTQIDFDGQSSTSKIIATDCSGLQMEPQIWIYPNPSNGEFNINLSELNGDNINLQIVDVTGRLLFEKQLNSSEHEVFIIGNETLHEDGVYYLILRTQNFKTTKTLIKLKN